MEVCKVHQYVHYQDRRPIFSAHYILILEWPTKHSNFSWNKTLQGREMRRVDQKVQFSSVQSLSHARLFATPWIAACQAHCPSPTPRVYSNSRPSSRWCHPAISSSVIPFSSCPQSLSASGSFTMSQLFTWGGQSIGVSALSISPSKVHPGLISFKMDWLDLLAVQGTLKSLLQHHSSKASIIRCSAFFTVQLSHPYMTAGKTIALTRRTFVSKIMSLLLNMLSRLVITFLPRSKRLLISWLQSPSAVQSLSYNKVSGSQRFTGQHSNFNEQYYGVHFKIC